MKSSKIGSQTSRKMIAKWLDIYAAHFNFEVKPEDLEAYMKGLSEYHSEQLDLAFLRAMRGCTFKPKVSEVIAQIEPMAGVDPDTGKKLLQYATPTDPDRCYGDNVINGYLCGCPKHAPWAWDQDDNGAWRIRIAKERGCRIIYQ